jgi:hypothetical protein
MGEDKLVKGIISPALEYHVSGQKVLLTLRVIFTLKSQTSEDIIHITLLYISMPTYYIDQPIYLHIVLIHESKEYLKNNCPKPRCKAVYLNPF